MTDYPPPFDTGSSKDSDIRVVRAQLLINGLALFMSSQGIIRLSGHSLSHLLK